MSRIIYCDKCKKEFEYRSIDIKECSVEINRDKLLLRYFVCPFCRTIYKIFLVNDTKYAQLVDNLKQVEARIKRARSNHNSLIISKLVMMSLTKRARIEQYIDSMDKKYPGSFTIAATENNCMDESIVYLPRGERGSKGEK